MKSITVVDLAEALLSYPPESQVFLDWSDKADALTLHVHVEYDCYQMWNGESDPERYHQILTLDDLDYL